MRDWLFGTIRHVGLVALLGLSLLVGCAEGGVGQDAGETGDTAPSPEDTTPEPDTTADTGDPDTGVDAADSGCGTCCAEETRCADDTTLETCRADGSGWEETSCGEKEICKEGSCQPEPICTPGERTCIDDSKALVCRPSGTSQRTETCGADENCQGGDCRDGRPNGADCTTDGDCAGGTCRCGEEMGGICKTKPGRGLCTSKCGSESCDGGEICLSSSDFAGAGYDHCVESCTDTCSGSRLSCIGIPSTDGTWKKGCYFATVTPIGAKCTNQADTCYGGFCLTNYFPFDVCTRECDAEGQCPPGTACAELSDGEFYCSPMCGDGSFDAPEPCPLEKEMERIDITCANRRGPSGGVTRVCADLDS